MSETIACIEWWATQFHKAKLTQVQSICQPEVALQISTISEVAKCEGLNELARNLLHQFHKLSFSPDDLTPDEVINMNKRIMRMVIDGVKDCKSSITQLNVSQIGRLQTYIPLSKQPSQGSSNRDGSYVVNTVSDSEVQSIRTSTQQLSKLIMDLEDNYKESFTLPDNSGSDRVGVESISLDAAREQTIYTLKMMAMAAGACIRCACMVSMRYSTFIKDCQEVAYGYSNHIGDEEFIEELRQSGGDWNVGTVLNEDDDPDFMVVVSLRFTFST
ncbi:hypothetical protein H4219_004625 [Mycoemilia scoparia]|uniref:Uncharacterized protein n=1 Tax=Mycoemilia scoparia TaxID=417184 RepID=A0A9W7ZR20_9FUNG|nr:hypothetical protein H4219_004625 [Mycoemilia scoparia]